MTNNSHSDNIYGKLQEHLDSLPVGFSKTESGVQIDILKKIFEPEEVQNKDSGIIWGRTFYNLVKVRLRAELAGGDEWNYYSFNGLDITNFKLTPKFKITNDTITVIQRGFRKETCCRRKTVIRRNRRHHPRYLHRKCANNGCPL